MTYAWICWTVFLGVIIAIVFNGNDRTVVPVYRLAALNWISGRPLYDGTGMTFLYFPQAAILFTPFAALFTQTVGEALWRLLTIGVLAGGLWRFAQLGQKKWGAELFPLMTLVTIPMACSCARNGQATLIITGLMLLAVADMATQRWWRTTLWLSLGVAIKPLTLVLLLLVMATKRTLLWRLAVGLAMIALVPFMTSNFTYVLQQYSACLSNTLTAAHVGVVTQGMSTPFTTLHIVGVNVSEHIQTAIRVIGALVTLGLYILAERRHDTIYAAIFAFSLAMVYLLLFNPRTENNTYVMLGPALAWFFAQAVLIEKRTGAVAFLGAITLMMIIGSPLERLIAPGMETIWLSPLMTVCFAGYLLWKLVHPIRKPPGTATGVPVLSLSSAPWHTS